MSLVKLSKKTQNLLKNFATINKSIVIDPGNSIRTLSVNKNIFASAVVSEDFPQEIAIYDLGNFLSTLSLFESPVFDFSNPSKLITTDETSNSRGTFYYSDPSVIPSVPNKGIQMPDVDVQFSLKTDTLQDLIRAASVYQVPDLCLYNKGEDIRLQVCDKKNETSNTYSVPVGKNKSSEDFCYCFKVENLKILPGDYAVSVAKNKVSHFVSAANNVEYYIALEPDTK
tara:strand:- start:471 stop:1151 length:681 start_codon:yes stop_codon:yes gene_type:complete